MRLIPTCLAVALVTVVVASCGGSPAVTGWRGADVHLVDGAWIGTEIDCSNGGRLPSESLAPALSHERDSLECRTIIDRAMAAVEPSVRSSMTRIVLATLPETYVTADGKELRPRLTGGIMTRKAVVIDHVDGSRQVIGLWCYLPSGGDGGLNVSAVTCDIAPLDDWQDGTVPPSYSPGAMPG